MEEAVVARLAALEFIAETFMANFFADLPSEAIASFAQSVAARAYDATIPLELGGAEREFVIRQSEAVGDATIHRMARIAERTEQVRSAKAR